MISKKNCNRVPRAEGGGFKWEEMTKKKRPSIVVAPGDSDEVAMVRFAREYPEYVQGEREFF